MDIIIKEYSKIIWTKEMAFLTRQVPRNNSSNLTH